VKTKRLDEVKALEEALEVLVSEMSVQQQRTIEKEFSNGNKRCCLIVRHHENRRLPLGKLYLGFGGC